MRTAIAVLRRQLELPAVTSSRNLLADRSSVWLDRVAVSTNVLEIEAAEPAAGAARDPAERISRLELAVSLYRGPLLPGIYDEWAVRERERLQMRRCATLLDLAAELKETGDCLYALECAYRAITEYLVTEEAHCALERLFACTGPRAAVTRLYR